MTGAGTGSLYRRGPSVVFYGGSGNFSMAKHPTSGLSTANHDPRKSKSTPAGKPTRSWATFLEVALPSLQLFPDKPSVLLIDQKPGDRLLLTFS